MKNEIIEHRKTVAENIIKSFDCDIEKAFPIGTVRNWGGVDYKKVGDNEWVKVESGKSVANSTILKRLKEDVKDLEFKRNIVTFQEKEKRAREVGKPTESAYFRTLWNSKFSKEIEYVNKVREIDDKIKDVLGEISELSTTIKSLQERKKKVTTNDELFKNLDLYILKRFGWLEYIKGDNGELVKRNLSAKEALGETADPSNYFLYTEAVFDEIIKDKWEMYENKINRKFIDAVVEFNKMKESGKYEYTHSPKSDSEYLVDKENGVVYRIANHWGKCASCNWYIRHKGEKDGIAEEGRYILAKCDFSSFRRKDTDDIFYNPEYMRASINAVEDCLKKIKSHLDSGVVFSKSAKNEMINSWDICKRNLSNVNEILQESVNKLIKEGEKIFQL